MKNSKDLENDWVIFLDSDDELTNDAFEIFKERINEANLLNTKKWPEQKNLTKDDVLIQLGDFGFLWHKKNSKGEREDLYWQNWFAKKKYTLLEPCFFLIFLQYIVPYQLFYRFHQRC